MILGKFLPPHAGHQYLVDFARRFCERLTVLVCSIAREPIPGELRYAWMRELFPGIRILHVAEELPQEPSEHPRFWEIWREAIHRTVCEPIDFVFASEDYGHRLASELGATFVPVDLGRSAVGVSGSAVRAAPLKHWKHIPVCVRPYFVKRVCVFGPESTGKSTLARDLAAHFDTVHVPEFARGWLDPRQGVCTPADIPIIARGQLAAEDALARQANHVLFCDTDLLLTTIWSEVLFGDCPAWIREEAGRRCYDLYLLLDVDVPWVDDSQRYLPERRQEFFDRCRRGLDEHNRPHTTLRGDWADRFERACSEVRRLLIQDDRTALPHTFPGTDVLPH
jgi:HTH-type transcriptional regulator, transcriptional repressor of NAD biosynthesis genes